MYASSSFILLQKEPTRCAFVASRTSVFLLSFLPDLLVELQCVYIISHPHIALTHLHSITSLQQEKEKKK
jgi:hypothetical protein